MKTTLPCLGAALMLSAVTLWPNAAFGQTTVMTSTAPVTSIGTVTTFSPDTITVQGDGGSPTAYRYSKSTTYVDETGAPVSIETVRSGLPVTVYYTQDGGTMTASKVVVRRSTVITD